jgi:hypothetical protein
LSDGKYIVIKQKAWDDFLVDIATPALNAKLGAALNGMLETGEVQDAVVIRRQDVFAPPALDAYANSIKVAVLAMRESALAGGYDLSEEDAEIVERLQGIADYFHGQAVLAWDAKRKLPD